MGVSTDAILVFGIDLGLEDETPGFMEEFGDFDDYLDALSGLPAYGEAGHSFADQRAYRDSVPADLVPHCSYDYPMYILAVRNSEIRACRGDALELSGFPVVPQEKIAAFKAWCTERGITDDPKWILCSMWG